jgi:hypothetical protein
MDSESKTKNSESKNSNYYTEDKYLSNHSDSQILNKYIHDIKNSKTFSINILKNINNLSYDDRMKILIVYNEMISYYVSLFED